MVNKRFVFFSLISLCLIFSIVSVSAFSFSDWYGKITGRIAMQDDSYGDDYTSDESTTPTITCTDSDGGQNVNVKGNTNNKVNGIGSSFDDVCSSYGTGVYEGYCSGNTVTNYLMSCPSGTTCTNGACQATYVEPEEEVQPTLVTCTSFTYSSWSTCTNGQQTRTITSQSPSGCVGGASTTVQACTSTTPVYPTSINSTCIDSDGFDVNYNGTVKFSNSTVNLTLTDTCSNNIITEFYCLTPQTFAYEIGACPYGCSSQGACQYPAPKQNLSCTDSDSKISSEGRDSEFYRDYYKKGNTYGFFLGSGQTPYFLNYSDICLSQTKLRENECFIYASSGEPLIEQDEKECIFGCSDGACIKANGCNDISEEITIKTGETNNISIGGNTYNIKLLDAFATSYGDLATISVNGQTYKLVPEGTGVNISSNGVYLDVLEILYSMKVDQSKVILVIHYNCSFVAPEPTQIPVCSNLTYKINTHSSFELYNQEYIPTWKSNYSSYWTINGVSEKYAQFNAAWRTSYDSDGDEREEYFYLTYQLNVFDNKNVDLESEIESWRDRESCTVHSFWAEDNSEEKVLICNNDWFDSELPDYYAQNSQQIIWFKDNILVNAGVYLGDYLSDEQIKEVSQKKAVDLINSISNNKLERIDWTKFSIIYPVSNVLARDLTGCNSDITASNVKSGTNESCYPDWNCKIEPAICPPHGYQTRICIDYSCDQKREEKVSCSPGLCSGCMVPRWFGDKYSNNVCIPYGFRFASESGESIKLVENTESDVLSEGSTGDVVSLLVVTDNMAILTLSNGDQNFVYNLTEGMETDITEALLAVDDNQELVSAVIIPTNIVYSSSGESYVELDINFKSNRNTVDTFNAYCDFNGQVQPQKGNSDSGSVSCQNNYECLSNVCSNGECINIQKEIQEASRMREVVLRILCRISSALTSETYAQCIADSASA